MEAPYSKGYIACDPGAKGSICLLVPDTNKIMFIDNTAIPMDIATWIQLAKKEYIIYTAMIEKVHAIQGTSAGSNFKFGYNTGLITGVIQTLGLGLEQITPKQWQKYIGVKSKGSAIKKEVAAICERLYPGAEIRGPRGGLLDGRSDALMIAHYASKHLN